MDYQLINPIDPELSALEQVLVNRGFTREDIPAYLNLTEDCVNSPLLLDNIDRAAKLIAKHLLDENGYIFVQVDSDCDGYTSAATLLNYIYKAFPSAITKTTYTFHDGKVHGINLDLVPPQATLVIAPDSSSNDYEEHKILSDRGVDVLVIDHHLAERVSEYACVVNNQLCDYPNKTLSGVGVVYKVCKRLDELMQTDYADELIDLVMCGLIGDMMDLRNMETRYLIQQGLEHIRNPFMKGMTEKNAYSLGSEITPIGIAFYVVPLINAITRVGTREEKELLFESMLEYKAYNLVPSTKRGCKGQTESIVEQAVRTCTNVKNRQTKMRDAAAEAIEHIIAEKHLLSAHKLLLIRLENMAVDPGLRGLIANELMSKYQRPVALLAKTEKGWEGSARGYERSRMNDFRQFCRHSGLVMYAEGHANAFGLGIAADKYDEFVAYADEELADIEFSPSYKVDFIYDAKNLQPQTILELGDMKHLWGQNIPEPLVVVENIPVSRDMLTLMSRDKNPTLKIQFTNGVACIKFHSSETEYESLYSENGCVYITVIGKCEVNRYYTKVTPQIIVEDYEILSRQEWYF